MKTALDAIEDVWMEHSDFEDGGFEYVSFIIRNDLQDMEDEDWEEEECIEELADVCINALRMMMEKGYEPEDVLLSRLSNHEQKNPEDIIDDYRDKYHRHRVRGLMEEDREVLDRLDE